MNPRRRFALQAISVAVLTLVLSTLAVLYFRDADTYRQPDWGPCKATVHGVLLADDDPAYIKVLDLGTVDILMVPQQSVKDPRRFDWVPATKEQSHELYYFDMDQTAAMGKMGDRFIKQMGFDGIHLHATSDVYFHTSDTWGGLNSDLNAMTACPEKLNFTLGYRFSYWQDGGATRPASLKQTSIDDNFLYFTLTIGNESYDWAWDIDGYSKTILGK